MKKFVIPKMEIIHFEVEDIITTSNYETPVVPIAGIASVSEDECAKISIGD